MKAKAWYRWQKLVASLVGGRLTPASGALPGWKADVQTEHRAFECKHTDKMQYTLKASDIAKGKFDAAKEGLEWAMAVRMRVPGSEKRYISVVVVPIDDYVEMLDRLEELV